jgi:hypothetical protein
MDSKLSMLFRLYDEFGVYPKKLGLEISGKKENWYCTFNQDHIQKIGAGVNGS